MWTDFKKKHKNRFFNDISVGLKLVIMLLTDLVEFLGLSVMNE